MDNNIDVVVVLMVKLIVIRIEKKLELPKIEQPIVVELSAHELVRQLRHDTRGAAFSNQIQITIMFLQ